MIVVDFRLPNIDPAWKVAKGLVRVSVWLHTAAALEASFGLIWGLLGGVAGAWLEEVGGMGAIEILVKFLRRV